MSLIDDIGNALSSVVGAVGNVLTTTVNTIANTVKSTFVLLLVYSIAFFGKPPTGPYARMVF